VDDLFQWFDDDEVVPIPPVVPITPVNVPAPENANGSPSTIVISEGAPAVTESLDRITKKRTKNKAKTTKSDSE
ncbi:hypothetical protein Tco_0416055, partial [Tanacetum coccineum]